MENALSAKPEDVHQQYARRLKDLHEAEDEAMLELRTSEELGSLARKNEP